MALGGGIWAVQNKVLPGTYINFSSVAKASATLSDRGYAAMPLMLDWGPDSTVFTVTSGDFQKNSLKIFGHAYTDDALLPLRELFQYTQTLYAYRLNGGGAKATCAYCTAKYSGIAGNKLYVVIAANADNADLFDVSLYYDTTLLDTQTVAAATALKDNDFVTWKTTASLAATAKTPLTGGTNGTAKVEDDLLTLEVETQPSLTYALDIEHGRIRGMVDELESLRQAIYLILSTERYAYLIYSWNYGVELVELIGQPKEYALPEIKRCITEALLQDDRITAVDGFEFETGKKTVHVTFTVHSIFGDLEVETDV